MHHKFSENNRKIQHSTAYALDCKLEGRQRLSQTMDDFDFSQIYFEINLELCCVIFTVFMESPMAVYEYLNKESRN